MLIGYFSVIGFYLFRGKTEGYLNFSTQGNTLYQMTILLTTSNFPDIMLPALYDNQVYFFFFFIYLVLGLYFLLNVLLATIFSGYKNKLAERAIETAKQRLFYLDNYFDKCDTAKKGHLNLCEARKFFQIILNLDYKK